MVESPLKLTDVLINGSYLYQQVGTYYQKLGLFQGSARLCSSQSAEKMSHHASCLPEPASYLIDVFWELTIVFGCGGCPLRVIFVDNESPLSNV